VVGVGATPMTGWLGGSGLDISNGVLCTAAGAAVDSLQHVHSEIVAAGDIARWANLRFDGIPRRIEHWIHAVEMGPHVAHTLLRPEEAQPFTPIPRFWSEQHGTKIQAAGMPGPADTITVVEGSVGTRSLVAAYTRADTLVGVVTINAPKRLQHYTTLIAQPNQAVLAATNPGRLGAHA
ncbi:oxidoreductase C-terminal domain-containing protein, partial [Aeromicrobium sp.]|uniref:oxidoreductase C-terminal domain-containing protein n=1 Tax=Aeromicrobium sp. TaxID=1871063 RepID=UPI0019CDB9C6